MTRIQSSVGLITGLPIQETVEQLLAVAARPRELIATRNQRLQQQQAAITELTARVLGVQFAARNLGRPSVFDTTAATSSNESALAVTVTGSPALGSRQFTPVRPASNHQVLSSGVAAVDQPLPAGELSFRFGGFIDDTADLETLNGGQGVARGKVRITDRSGATAVIDLRFARTIGDVLDAINAADDIQVTALARGDRLELRDDTNQTTANLRVQEVGAGSTAADLGLAGINVAADSATGANLVRLYEGLKLDRLNDGNGVDLRTGAPDLHIAFREGGSSLAVAFRALEKEAGFAAGATHAAAGLHARVQITATATGAAHDNVRLQFVADASVTAGAEVVEYNASNPSAVTITVQIAAGATTANHVIDALNGDPFASQHFTAARFAGGNGQGLVGAADFAVTRGGAPQPARNEQTIGDILATLNAADPVRLQARLSADGQRIELLDLTSGSGEFQVSAAANSNAAADLGLLGRAADAGVLAGRRLLSGLQGPLLSSLGGGQGVGTLGLLTLTDRGGASQSVDLSDAETLGDVLAAINNLGLNLRAEYNPTHTGWRIVDTTAAPTGNLIVASGDATNTAQKLGVAVDAAGGSVDSGALKRQVVSRATRLDDLFGGQGIERGQFLLKDSAGAIRTIDLRSTAVATVGDVIDLINQSGASVTARLNDAGDGLVLIDNAGGAQRLAVSDFGSGRTAASLQLVGEAVDRVVDGQTRQTIVGSTTFTLRLDGTATLNDVVEQLNARQLGVTASILSDGSGLTPYRLALSSQVAGARGRLLVDGLTSGLQFHQLSAGRDALLVVGDPDQAGALLASSSTNTFTSLMEGATLTIKDAATTPVTIAVTASNNEAARQIRTFVDAYNQLRDKLGEVASFDSDTNATGVLFGTNEVLRVDADISRLLSGRFFGAGSIQSLAEVGLSLDDTGKLAFDEAKFNARTDADRAAVKEFFTKAELGMASKLDRLAESLVGVDRSLLLTRAQTLAFKMEVNNEQIRALNVRLERERERLLRDFYNLELAIGKMQNHMTAIQSLQPLTPLSIGRQ